MDIAFSSRRMAIVAAAWVQPEWVEDSNPMSVISTCRIIFSDNDAAYLCDPSTEMLLCS